MYTGNALWNHKEMMFTKNPVRVAAAILGISSLDGKQSPIMIPKGAIVHVLSYQKANNKRLRDVIWDGHREAITVFKEDLDNRGTLLRVRTRTGLNTGSTPR